MYTRQVAEVLRLLEAAGIPAIDLAKYDGRTVLAVKVGTIKRAKGLEFEHVLVAHIRRTVFRMLASASRWSRGNSTWLRPARETVSGWE
jgi:superfamily I DNA/RNA helicase